MTSDAEGLDERVAVAVALKFIEGFATKDFDGLYGLLADGAEMVSRQGVEVPSDIESRRLIIARHKRIHEIVVGSMPNGLRITPTSIVAQGDKVCVEAKGTATTGAGREYNNRYHFAFEIRDGKIQAVREYLDTLYLAEAQPELVDVKAQVAREFPGI